MGEVEGLRKTIMRLVEQKTALQIRIGELEKMLGLVDETGFVEKPSLPLIKFGINSSGAITPYCEKHGAMLAYKHEIYRCEACKTGISMKDIREAFERAKKA